MPPGSPPPDGGTSLPTSVWLRRRLPQRNWRHRAAWSFRRATPISQMATARTWWRSVDSQEQMEQRMSAWHTATRDSHFSVRSKPWCLLSSAYTAWLYRPLYIGAHVAACSRAVMMTSSAQTAEIPATRHTSRLFVFKSQVLYIYVYILSV